jgi:hypothetical protein
MASQFLPAVKNSPRLEDVFHSPTFLIRLSAVIFHVAIFEGLTLIIVIKECTVHNLHLLSCAV